MESGRELFLNRIEGQLSKGEVLSLSDERMLGKLCLEDAFGRVTSIAFGSGALVFGMFCAFVLIKSDFSVTATLGMVLGLVFALFCKLWSDHAWRSDNLREANDRAKLLRYEAARSNLLPTQ
jgi:hypothetical protein